MNLKTAARVLGVHYQTAYRWVRSGELVAVKVGTSYQVTDAAITQVLARRAAAERAVEVSASMHPLPSTGASIDDPRAQIRELLDHTTLSTRPVYETVVRALAELVGDACVLRMLSDDGRWLEPAAIHHRDPARWASLAAMHDSALQPATEGLSSGVISSGEILHIDHLDQRRARREIPPAFRQDLDDVGVFSVVIAPVTSASGHVLGTVELTRDAPGSGYSSQEVELVVDLAGLASEATRRADGYRAGWCARGSLHHRVEAVLARYPEAGIDELTDTIANLLDPDPAEAVVGLDRRIVACNEPFAALLGLPRETLLGTDWTGVAGCAEILGGQLWERLVTGDIELLDSAPGASGTAEMAPPAVHLAVVRRPDATPALVVAACDASPGTGIGRVTGPRAKPM